MTRPPVEMTICAKCRHHHQREDGPRTEVWYNQFCRHPELERVLGIDPVLGKKRYFTRNDLGRVYPTEDRHPYCRDINTDGDCSFYEPKGIVALGTSS